MLLDSLLNIKGVGQNIEKNLTSLVGGNRIFDLLLHKPVRIEKINFQPRLFDVKNDELVVIKAKVESHHKPTKARAPYKVVCYTPTGFVTLVFFKIFPNQIKQMPIGQEIAIFGVLQKKSDENQISHPELIFDADKIDLMPRVKIIYPLKFPLSNKFLNSKIQQVLFDIDKNQQKIDQEKYEWIDNNLKKRKGWPNFLDSLQYLHFRNIPKWNFASKDDKLNNRDNDFNSIKIPGEFNKANERLSYDEFLAWQFSFMLAKKFNKNQKKKLELTKDLLKQFIDNLHFSLTNSQQKAIDEIAKEISSSKKMLRLLQGDVGSGKTLVAIASCLQVISAQKQSCVLCPTTVLAKQHFKYFKDFLSNLDIKIEVLTSSATKKQKSNIIKNLQGQNIDILIATHAVLEDDIKFKDLGLAIIDEQHRFGVVQRLKLVSKGRDVDTLLMSATPIPRSLMMSFYGDMDITILNEKPKNRQLITTSVISQSKSIEICDAIKRNIFEGKKVYWICPAIDSKSVKKPEDHFAKEVEVEDELENVTNKYNELSKIINKEYLAIIHGQMKEKEKEEVMNDFANCEGKAKLLIATTVIEVGIDVPDATIIVIENAERFGLAQLHQIRGRVGRSDKKSYCILLYGKKLGKSGIRRLSILKNSNDGFYIAEQDLKIRGSGDLIGTKQSGFPNFKIANLEDNYDLMQIANENAEFILRSDPDLSKDINKKYRYLIKLFGYDECLEMIKSG